MTSPWDRPRAEPLEARALLAEGMSAHAVGRKLLGRLDDAAPRGLAGLNPARILLFGDRDLPWVDGVRWFGIDPKAPNVYLPTAVLPAAPVDLLGRALRRTYRGPVLYDVAHARAYPLEAARPVSAARLQSWLEHLE